jgi:hypothetical protein
MGGEAFVYPLLILAVTVASALIALIFRRMFGAKYRFVQFSMVAVAAPMAFMLMAMRNPEMAWEYVRFSTGLAAVASCTVAIPYVLIRLPK